MRTYVKTAPVVVVLLLACVAAAFAAQGPRNLPPGFEALPVGSGLTLVTAMDFAPDGRLFVCEHSGSLRIVKNDEVLPTPFMTIPVHNFSEQGLLGVAFDPNFATNRFLYVFYTAPSAQNRVSRFTASATNPDVVEPNSELVLLDNISGGDGVHNGGGIHFGPDGMLYITTGDVGFPPNSQDLSILAGKMLRINPHTFPNIIPSDNPFVGTAGARGEIWALGLRNPVTFALDPVTGKMYVNDVGQFSYEEVNLAAKKANYGWPTCEGPCSNPNFTNPIYSYPHPNGDQSSSAIVGGTFYRATQFPAEYQGNYIFTDFGDSKMWRLTPSNQPILFSTDTNVPVDLKVAPDGSLYVLSYFDGLYKIQFVGSGNKNPIAVASASPTSGTPPLQVNFSGSGSSDPDGDALQYEWDFGDGSAPQQGVNVTHTYGQAGPYTATLTVHDGKGGSGSATVMINVGNPPVGQITAPAVGTTYSGGDTISFQGTATDAEDGTLPPSAFSWTVLFHHRDHTHPFIGPLDGVTSGSFTIPTVGETDSVVFYRIYLTVTDSTGLTHEVTRDVLPKTSTITLATDPPGLELTLDGQPTSTPHSVVGVVGIVRTLGATSPQTVGSTTYAWSSWSDAGALSHSINTPAVDTTYTATFSTSGGGGPSTQNVVWTNPVGVIVTGNSLTQNTCDGCSGGAVSTQTLVSGDGYVEFTAQETTSLRGAGLSNGNSSQEVSDIDFAIHLNPGGVAYVRESGVYQTETSFTTGAVFRIAVQGGQVKYLKNGAVFYTSTKAPVYPLLMDASLATTGSTIKNAIISGNLSGGSPPPNDTTPPAISAVTAGNVTANAATITWSTDEASDSQVVYGTTSGSYPNASPVNAAAVTAHGIDLGGLSPSTTYFYQVKSKDAAGNLATSAEFTFVTAAGQSTPTTENVVWTNAAGVTVTGNSLTQASCDGCQVGASSAQSIVSGDGYVEFTAQETTTLRAAGLSNGNTDGSFLDIDFAVQLNAGGAAYIRENGVYKTETSFTTGAVFRIAVAGGQVKYLKNGTVFYTSAKAPVFPLLMDASLATTGSTITNAVISGNLGGGSPPPPPPPGDTTPPVISGVTPSLVTATSARINWNTDEASDSQVVYGTTSGSYPNASAVKPAMVTSHFVNLPGLSASTTYFYQVKSRDAAGNLATSAEFTFTTSASGSASTQNVVWTNAVGVTVTGNSLTQNSCNGCQVGAVSAQTIVSGDGYVEFTAQETTTLRGAGLSNGNTDGSFPDIDFSVQLNPGGVAYVRENGVYKTETSFTAGAVFRIAVVGGQVTYLKNGTVFYTSTKAPTYPLLMDASLATTGSTVKNAIISGQLSGP